jgi:hypothetical protein
MFANNSRFKSGSRYFYISPNEQKITFIPGGKPGDGFTFAAVVPLEVRVAR